MTLTVRPMAGRRRDMRMSLRAGTAVAALVLSSCSAIGLNEESEADSQSALAAGLPLPLATPMAVDWVDQAAPSITTDPPLLLALVDAAEPAEIEVPGTALETGGADAVHAIWSGVLLNTESLGRFAAADIVDDNEPLPLLVADGRYHWLPETGTAGTTGLSATSCIRDIGADLSHVDCAEWSDQIALAPTTVDDALLADQRGGFITVGGLQIDIGIRVETLVNGVTQLTTALTLDDVINGGLENMRIGQVRVTEGDAATDIIHNVGLGSVNTIISNSQDDVNISTLATLAIDVINLRLPQVGNSFNATGRMPPELQQSIVRGISP